MDAKTDEHKDPTDKQNNENGENAPLEKPTEAKQLVRNAVSLSVSIFFFTTAASALSTLQSSVNCEGGVGVYSLLASTICMLISTLLLPSFVIRHLGIKKSVVLCLFILNIYTVVNFYPKWWTLIPGAMVSGTFTGVLLAAQSTYVSTNAMMYATVSGKPQQETVRRFWGIFVFVLKLSNILSNLLSSVILNQDNATPSVNATFVSSCGAQDCPTVTSTSFCNPPDRRPVNLLLSILLASGLFSALFGAIFIQDIQTSDTLKSQSNLALFFATTRLMRDTKVILMVPLCVFIGMLKGFFIADWTRSYITCTVGVGIIGYTMMTFGATSAVSAAAVGVLSKYTGLKAMFSFAAAVTAGVLATLLVWQANTSDVWFLFLIAGIVGGLDSIWLTQISAFFPSLFPDKQEAAFSNLRMWQSLGFVIAFAYSNLLCVWIKITLIGIVLGYGMCGFIIVDDNESWKARKNDGVKQIKDKSISTKL